MADQRVTELVAVVTPAATDILAVRQVADNRDKKLTVQQILDQVPAGGGLPEYLFYADQMENPVNADWDINSLAPAAADSNNAALTVRLFDDTVQEAVGMSFKLPGAATQMTLEWVSRAETAPGGAVVAKPAIEIRTIGDDAVVPAPPWTSLNLVDTDLPTNENFQYDSQTITFASLSLTAGDYVQMQFARNPGHPNDDLVGDWAVLSVLVSFS
jgi:hypothetical protein